MPAVLVAPSRRAGHELMTTAGPRPSALTRSLLVAASRAAAAAGLLLASNHPLWPGVMSVAFMAWCVVASLRPGAWLVVLPATLPWLNFSPWSGWLVFDEFDLAVLGAAAAQFACLGASSDTTRADTTQRPWGAIVIALACLGLIGLWRGLADAGVWSFSLFQGYVDPLNSVRIFKPLLHVLLLLPLVQHALRDVTSIELAMRRVCRGMLLGLSAVVLAVLWDRAAHPGLLNFSSTYRTVALFWEMHVGGAAIDVYLTLATPFIAWSILSATTPLRWVAAASLALLTEYACLTTFSRGVYGSVIVSLVVLGWLWRRQRADPMPGRSDSRFRVVCASLLATLMLIEAALVLGSGTFMMNRISAGERDFRSRLIHWQNGVNLLQTPADWLVGIGSGRFPARYAAIVPAGEFPGSIELGEERGNRFVRLLGPRTMVSLGGLYELTQRVPIQASQLFVAKFDVRASRSTHLRLSVCEVHLLYERHCQTAEVSVQSQGTGWEPVSAALLGPQLASGPWYAPRMGVFSVSVLDAAGAVELDNLSLQNASGAEQLQNGEFTQQLAHWFPVAKNQFLPWHIDNLYLETLIDHGLSGLIAFIMLLGYALWNLCLGPASRLATAPVLAASLSGALTIGLVSSVMDVPRVAFLLLLLTAFSVRLNAGTEVER